METYYVSSTESPQKTNLYSKLRKDLKLRRSGVFVVSFKQILHLFLVLLYLALKR